MSDYTENEDNMDGLSMERQHNRQMIYRYD